ncbi:ATP-binding protein [Veillonella sp.]|jgi:hypothetical protein|uniref:AAA family ATPase n=1 Tax=Veillonella sp. TaxID=1926307 RepID=UPI0028E2A21A|nr:ATP-binding protein [Veillonella sp.]MDU3434764.1 ATP-binding protein [Veillonella sp.]MDU6207496.1 ATP-binding protein [Veillonella sp.]
MLIDFSVAGFASIQKRQELTFCAFSGQRIKGTKYEDNYILTSESRPAKSTIIFGNNAVGKTNLLHAIDSLIHIIKEEKIFSNNRLFNILSNNIQYNITVESKQENLYQYSLVIDKNQTVLSEKLEQNNKIIYKFEDNILSSDVLEDAVTEIYSRKSTATILSKIKDFISDIYIDFIDTINSISVITDPFINPDVKPFNITITEDQRILIEENKDLTLEILAQLDGTISSIELEKRTIAEEESVSYDVYIVRDLGEQDPVRLPLAYESKGIKRIMAILTSLLRVHNGRTVLIDELDASISTKSLILLFNHIINSNSNTCGQLVVTSHNLELFNINLFAPEQIYITTKDQTLSTIVNSLADFDLRSNKKRLAIDYLQGKFEV